MKLKYLQEHISIMKFNDTETPDFTILTGLNGVGKSHLLQAIEQNKVIIEGFENSNIVQFDYETFKLENESNFNAQQISQERDSAWNFFIKDNGGNIKNNIKSWKNSLGINYQTIVKICEIKKKPLFSLTKKDINNDPIFEQLKGYKQNIKNHFRNNSNLKDNQQAQAILSLIKKFPYSINEISETEFKEKYKPYSFKQDFLPQNLGKIFMDYWTKYEQNQYNKFRNENTDENHRVLSDEEFIKIHGKKPWDMINEILRIFRNLPYEVNSPENLNRDNNFQLKLKHLEKANININFSDLSSGERILMALIASIYKSSSDKHFPDILLLDEIDASLHPSMMKNLLKVIEDVFLKNSVKVILVTHSPSTIAFAPEKSIFIMNKDGENRIEKKTKEEALDILSEGFASLSLDESNLSISYNITKNDLPVVFTEGISDKIILETAWKKLYTKEMPFYIQDAFDASFLGNLFRRGDDVQDGIFQTYNDRKFIALFDFDKSGYNSWNNLLKFSINKENNPLKCLTKKHQESEAYALLLPVPDTDVKKQVIKNDSETFKDKSELSIELLFYGVERVNDFFTKEVVTGGNEIIKFVGGKRKFSEKVDELEQNDFKNFMLLFDKIKELFEN